MEALAIIGGISAVAELSSSAVKCSKILYKVSKNAGALQDEVEDFAQHFNIFVCIVTNTHKTCRDHYLNDNRSLALQRCDEHKLLDALADRSKFIIKRVEKLKPELKPGDSSPGFRERLRWLFLEKEERDVVCRKMQEVQLSFQMIMAQITYEVLQQRAANPTPEEEMMCNFRKEMREVRLMMKTHIRAMNALTSRQLKTQHQYYEKGPEGNFKRATRILVDFGYEIVTDSVPPSSSSFSSGTGNGSRSSNGLSDDNEVYEIHQPVRPPGQRIPSFHRSHSSHSSHSSGMRQESPPIVTVPFGPQGRNHLSHFVPLPTRQAPSIDSNSNLRFLELTARRRPNPAPRPPVQEGQFLEDGDYMAVRASENIINLDLSSNAVIQGYINSKQSPVTANINQALPNSVISQRYAVELGLDFEDFDDDDDQLSDEDSGGGIKVDFGQGNAEAVVGSVVFSWSNLANSPGGRQFKPLNIRCFVCNEVPSQLQLILGKNFLEKRNYD